MPPTHLADAEYAALRATIRQRGTTRLYIVWGGVAAWGALILVALTQVPHPGRALIPLVVLAATFEINFFVHTGVERIGRYLQVFYEEASASVGWETTAMAYGGKYPGGLDPLFANTFFSAMAVNFLIAAPAAIHQPGWIAISAIAHVALAYRIILARRAAAIQRTVDLDRFRSLGSR